MKLIGSALVLAFLTHLDLWHIGAKAQALASEGAVALRVEFLRWSVMRYDGKEVILDYLIVRLTITFLLMTGYEQAGSVVAAWVGDWDTAQKVELVLPMNA